MKCDGLASLDERRLYDIMRTPFFIGGDIDVAVDMAATDDTEPELWQVNEKYREVGGEGSRGRIKSDVAMTRASLIWTLLQDQ